MGYRKKNYILFADLLNIHANFKRIGQVVSDDFYYKHCDTRIFYSSLTLIEGVTCRVVCGQASDQISVITINIITT